MQVEAVFAPTRRWYVVLVEPSAEAKVAERAGELGIEVYFPRSRRPAIVAPGRKAPALKEIERPALPGYVFVALPISNPRFDLFQGGNWTPSHNKPIDDPDATPWVEPEVAPIFGARGFIAIASGPLVIDPAEIVDLRRREREGDFDTVARSPDGRRVIPKWIKQGIRIEFTDGPFKGHFGAISKPLGGGLVDVWAQFLASTRLIPCPIDWLRKAA